MVLTALGCAAKMRAMLQTSSSGCAPVVAAKTWTCSANKERQTAMRYCRRYCSKPSQFGPRLSTHRLIHKLWLRLKMLLQENQAQRRRPLKTCVPVLLVHPRVRPRGLVDRAHRRAISFGLMGFWVNGVERNLSTRKPPRQPTRGHAPYHTTALSRQDSRFSARHTRKWRNVAHITTQGSGATLPARLTMGRGCGPRRRGGGWASR